ncbi:mediator of RNA polymerase II transcription subunit 21 [Platysternon megacephalum]|uniref:Mediator of RNA polymerase II transcription subunit 21 n=1 Tax=Platysternon megacephalum TaxID=55544 RepID=A0A4D9E149_9SAUR|nr:mediator of RNA polymerase II transcription subunit 21 [Platysternon megacephalum]
MYFAPCPKGLLLGGRCGKFQKISSQEKKVTQSLVCKSRHQWNCRMAAGEVAERNGAAAEHSELPRGAGPRAGSRSRLVPQWSRNYVTAGSLLRTTLGPARHGSLAGALQRGAELPGARHPAAKGGSRARR